MSCLILIATLGSSNAASARNIFLRRGPVQASRLKTISPQPKGSFLRVGANPASRQGIESLQAKKSFFGGIGIGVKGVGIKMKAFGSRVKRDPYFGQIINFKNPNLPLALTCIPFAVTAALDPTLSQALWGSWIALLGVNAGRQIYRKIQASRLAHKEAKLQSTLDAFPHFSPSLPVTRKGPSLGPSTLAGSSI